MADAYLASVPLLVAEFPRWLTYFAEHGPFTKPDQLALHRKTIEIRRSHSSVNSAIADPAFLTALHDTLKAWGLGSRSSHLRSASDIGSALRSARGQVVALEQRRIDSQSLNADATADAVWRLIQAIRVADNDTQLVAGTKTLHHLLPELVPPMDREYTQRFFRWQNTQFQYAQEKCFKAAFAALAHIAWQTKAKQYVGLHPWHTSTTKVLDNALVGFVRSLDDGPAIPLPKKLIKANPQGKQAAAPDNRFGGVWDRITANAGQQFMTITGLPFTYDVTHGAVRPSRTNRNLPRSDFEKALARVPLNDTTDVKDLQGPSFVYAIMMDKRIRLADW